MKKTVLAILGIFGLGVLTAQCQTLLNSWENSLEGWTIVEPDIWTTTGFSTTTGVTAGTYSWNLTAASSPDYGVALVGPSSTNLIAQLVNADSISIDVITPVSGSFGNYLQWDLQVNQPGGAGTISLDGNTFNQSAAIGGPESTLTWAVPASVREALAGNPTLPVCLSFSIGGGGSGTMYLDYLRINPLQSAVIEGTVYQGASSASTTPLQNWTVQAVSGGTAYYGISGANGQYAIEVPSSANYVVSSYNPPVAWNSVGGGPYTLNSVAGGSFYLNNNFTESPVAATWDAAVDLEAFFPYPLRSPCCGQNMTYVLSARNDSSGAVSGAEVFLDFSSSQTLTPPTAPPGWTVTTGPNTVTWTCTGNWPAGASQEFTATVTLPSSPCSGTFGALANIFYNGWGGGAQADVNIADNVSVLHQSITCSYDPNDMQVDPAGCGPEGYIPAGQPLTYTVKFQNTGNGPASLVVVSNTLDPHLDPTTVKVLGSSAPNVFQVKGNQLVWTFPNIYLPPQAENDIGSQGYVKYQVSPLASATVGSVITNNAQIYFDLNAPIMTVTTTNTITDDPAPVASFSVTPVVGSGGHTNSFTYTGGSSGATYLWNFGPDAVPSTSTDQNPSNVVFPNQGDYLVTLQVSLGDCMSDPAVQIVTVGFPVLNAELDGHGNLVFSWRGAGYHLQQRADLEPGTPWTAVTATVNQISSSFSVAIPLSANQTYYRLSQVPP